MIVIEALLYSTIDFFGMLLGMLVHTAVEIYETVLCMFEYSLSKFRWYRRLRGGRWELWFIDTPVGVEMWFQEDHSDGSRPGLGVMCCAVETY
jgi:hypothetical protein